MEKKFCIRFDVDTHVCLSKGMPALLKLAKEEDIKFTFFINMGKGFDRFNSIKNILTRFIKKQDDQKPQNLSMFDKLGKWESLIASFINPTVGARYVKVLQQASKEGHDLGLHGGKNHAHWEKQALSWSYEKLYSEVLFGVEMFKKAGLPKPTSFASPAWVSPINLEDVLVKQGFTSCANTKDILSDGISKHHTLTEVTTNILGKAADVGYIENLVALGFNDSAIIEDYAKQLTTKQNLAIVYEHPFYAGVHKIELLRQMIRKAKSLSFEDSTIKEMVESKD